MWDGHNNDYCVGRSDRVYHDASMSVWDGHILVFQTRVGWTQYRFFDACGMDALSFFWFICWAGRRRTSPFRPRFPINVWDGHFLIFGLTRVGWTQY